jgi:hypothetical protein
LSGLGIVRKNRRIAEIISLNNFKIIRRTY